MTKNEPMPAEAFKWKFYKIDSLMRLYYNPRDSENGFDAYLIGWVSGNFDDDWAGYESGNEYETLGSVEAFFDGIRHAWFPYMHYVQGRALLKLGTALDTLEEKYCMERD